jgi:hypothetical protein
MTNHGHSIAEMFRRQVEFRPYYASQRGFRPLGVRPVSGRLDGDADRPELTGRRPPLPCRPERPLKGAPLPPRHEGPPCIVEPPFSGRDRAAVVDPNHA